MASAPEKLGLLHSGGVDSSAILQAAESSNVDFATSITVVIVEPSNPRPHEDELYAIKAARLHKLSHNMKHSIVRLSPACLVKEYSRPTIETLALWGFMQTRNSLIISAALHEASKLGLIHAIVGDNADALFGGSCDVYFHEKNVTDPEGFALWHPKACHFLWHCSAINPSRTKNSSSSGPKRKLLECIALPSATSNHSLEDHS